MRARGREGVWVGGGGKINEAGKWRQARGRSTLALALALAVDLVLVLWIGDPVQSHSEGCGW